MAGRKLHMFFFFNSEKAFNLDPRKMIWLFLRRKAVMKKEIFAIAEMCKNIKLSVIKDFEVKVHLGSVLSPLLLAVVMDEITKV